MGKNGKATAKAGGTPNLQVAAAQASGDQDATAMGGASESTTSDSSTQSTAGPVETSSQAASTQAGPASSGAQVAAEPVEEREHQLARPAAPWSGKIAGLEVTSKQAGFRRAGRAWGTEPTVVKLSELSDEQVLQIRDEPMLSMRAVWLDAPTAD